MKIGEVIHGPGKVLLCKPQHFSNIFVNSENNITVSDLLLWKDYFC